jgi:transposase
MTSRRKFTSQFKKKVVLEALKERDTLSALAQKHKLHPQQITTWKAHFLANADRLFDKDTSTKDHALEKEKDDLLRTIGQQKVELDYLKKSLR